MGSYEQELSKQPSGIQEQGFSKPDSNASAYLWSLLILLTSEDKLAGLLLAFKFQCSLKMIRNITAMRAKSLGALTAA